MRVSRHMQTLRAKNALAWTSASEDQEQGTLTLQTPPCCESKAISQYNPSGTHGSVHNPVA